MAAATTALAQAPAQTGASPSAAAQCAGCHGAQGEGNSAANFPRIAGQPQYYLAKQLADYAGGARRNAVMEPIAKALNATDRDAVAGYYSRLTAPAQAPAAQASPETGKRARDLSLVGDGNLRVQACNNCHGPDGSGEPPAFPYIAGLDAKYLHAALTEWRSGARNNDPTKQMPMIAKALSNDDLAQLAQYYGAMTPPKPAGATITRAQGSAPAGKAANSAPANVSPQGTSSGTGVEQGAATSGGSQGPGGSGDSPRTQSQQR